MSRLFYINYFTSFFEAASSLEGSQDQKERLPSPVKKEFDRNSNPFAGGEILGF